MDAEAPVRRDVAIDCGWGRLLFGQTFDDAGVLLEELRAERPGRRDVVLYLRWPQVVVGSAPHDLFVDPSFTYRLHLDAEPEPEPVPTGLTVRRFRSDDAGAVNRVLARCGMLQVEPAAQAANAALETFVPLVAETAEGLLVGTVTGVDHVAAFGDPEGGSSLWCLAVDPQAAVPGVGRALVLALAQRLRGRGRRFVDLSVLSDNHGAIALYEGLGFCRVPILAVKRKNPINEPLFTPDVALEGLNPYARLIADEAHRRGIAVRVLDAAWGELELSHAGRRVVTRESLSELTSAVAMSRCDDKRVTRRILQGAGLRVPGGVVSDGGDGDAAFLAVVGEAVVKPARGEQGRGITVGVRTDEQLAAAVATARAHCPDVLVEECVGGEDLRIVVIDHEVVAAAVRRPAEVVGTGSHTVAQLIDKQSRRRAAATGGESTIPLDDHTQATVEAAGHGLHDVVPQGARIAVRRTANLHTGGTISDVTDRLSPVLADVAIRASRALSIPVVGLDLLVPDVGGPEYVLIEANERPGLANHEPQPTAQRFVDLLFPRTRR